MFATIFVSFTRFLPSICDLGLSFDDTLVKFEQLFKLLNGSILVTDGLVEGFDVTFLMFRQIVGVGWDADLRSRNPRSCHTMDSCRRVWFLRWVPRHWLRHSGRKELLVETWVLVHLGLKFFCSVSFLKH